MVEERDCEPSRVSDEALMAAFYEGSETAFQALSEQWWPRLFGYFRRRGVGAEDAEDLALQTLVKLYVTRERRKFDVNLPLAPFLFTVAYRLYQGWLRDQERNPAGVPLVEALDLASAPEDRHTGLSADVLHCIERLPEAEQLYVQLCARHGLGDLSHNEIAVVMEKWPAQITQISKRTQALLRQCLEKKGYR